MQPRYGADSDEFCIAASLWCCSAALFCCLATLGFCTAGRLGQAHAVLEGNHARGEISGAPNPGDARLVSSELGNI